MDERLQKLQANVEDSLFVVHSSFETVVENLREQGLTDEELRIVLAPSMQRLILSKKRRRKVFLIVGICLIAVGLVMLAINLWLASEHAFGLTYTSMIYDLGVNVTFMIIGSIMLVKKAVHTSARQQSCKNLLMLVNR